MNKLNFVDEIYFDDKIKNRLFNSFYIQEDTIVLKFLNKQIIKKYT